MKHSDVTRRRVQANRRKKKKLKTVRMFDPGLRKWLVVVHTGPEEARKIAKAHKKIGIRAKVTD